MFLMTSLLGTNNNNHNYLINLKYTLKKILFFDFALSFCYLFLSIYYVIFIFIKAIYYMISYNVLKIFDKDSSFKLMFTNFLLFFINLTIQLLIFEIKKFELFYYILISFCVIFQFYTFILFVRFFSKIIIFTDDELILISQLDRKPKLIF